MSTFGRLLARLRTDFPQLGITDKTQLVRSYLGIHQRDAGCYRWSSYRPNDAFGSPAFMSEWTASELVREPVLCLRRVPITGEIEVWPYSPKWRDAVLPGGINRTSDS